MMTNKRLTDEELDKMAEGYAPVPLSTCLKGAAARIRELEKQFAELMRRYECRGDSCRKHVERIKTRDAKIGELRGENKEQQKLILLYQGEGDDEFPKNLNGEIWQI